MSKVMQTAIDVSYNISYGKLLYKEYKPNIRNQNIALRLIIFQFQLQLCTRHAYASKYIADFLIKIVESKLIF